MVNCLKNTKYLKTYFPSIELGSGGGVCVCVCGGGGGMCVQVVQFVVLYLIKIYCERKPAVLLTV